MTQITVGTGVKYGFRQRGFHDALAGKDTAKGRALAERAGKSALEAYEAGARAGRREREKRAEGDAE